MTKIEGFQKFFNRKDIIAKHQEVEVAKKYLLDSGKLTDSEKEEIQDFDLLHTRGQSSLNYVIRRVNELVSFVNCR